MEKKKPFHELYNFFPTTNHILINLKAKNQIKLKKLLKRQSTFSNIIKDGNNLY